MLLPLCNPADACVAFTGDPRRSVRPTSSMNPILATGNLAAWVAGICGFGLSGGVWWGMNRRLRKARSEAETAARQLEIAVSMNSGLTHDLNNCITPVMTALDLFQTEDEGLRALNAKARANVAVMRRYLEQGAIFGQTLSPRFEPADIQEIVEGAVTVLADRVERSQVALDTSSVAAFDVTTDSVLLQRLVTNLAANALDASAPGTRIELRASVVEASRGLRYRIEIRDQGHGIDSENLNRVFTPYFSTRSTDDGVRGLGLTICEKIVHMHRGKIRIESKVGSGSTVTAEFPVDPTLS